MVQWTSKLPYLDGHLAKESIRVAKPHPILQQRVKGAHEQLNRSIPSVDVHVTALDKWDALEGDWNTQAPDVPHVLLGTPPPPPWCFQECNHKHE